MSQDCRTSRRRKGPTSTCERRVEIARVTRHTTSLEMDACTLIIFYDLLATQVVRLAGVTTRRKTVGPATRRFVARAKQTDILELVDQGLITPDGDAHAVQQAINHDPG